MRFSLRFVLPLILALGLLAYFVTPLADTLIFRWAARDLDVRSSSLAHALAEKAQPFSEFDTTLKDERLYALGFCDARGVLKRRTRDFPANLRCPSAARGGNAPESNRIVPSGRQGMLHVAFRPAGDGTLVLVHDMSFIQQRSKTTRRYIFAFFAGLGALISLLTVIIARLSFDGWVKRIRALLKGGHAHSKSLLQPTVPELRPIVHDLRVLLRDLESDRHGRDASQVSWSPWALKEVLLTELRGDEILVVSNREPYIHVWDGEAIQVKIPASGLVTALEPIMRACSGTWIAHGSGNADREVVDASDHVRVPPDNPSYQIRRVWLSEEEEKGYYFGFSNEGLWPLCHNAHMRPMFRASDWQTYRNVNQKFANAVVTEAKTQDPVILVQDYHFALLPKMIKQKLPNATIITFWHIPWPNPEAFGICPWREEILDGMLGSDILGFHTRFNCNNFMETIDRYLQCRIDRDTSTIAHGNQHTAVNAYPISIEFPSRWAKSQKTAEECRRRITESHGLPPSHRIGLGVDRLDYTKGIPERFLAVERLLEVRPEWIGNFTFIQIAAPSRSTIPQYKEFETRTRQEADRINARFGKNGYAPIIFKVEHHEPERVFEFFRAADLCLVSSLHDGMNLVSKEFIAARDDERGVLILSQFAGAAKELPEALIVNPYDVDQCATALHLALTMPEAEQGSRMRHMRGLIHEFNVYRWAGKMLIDAARLRNRLRFQETTPLLKSAGGMH